MLVENRSRSLWLSVERKTLLGLGERLEVRAAFNDPGEVIGEDIPTIIGDIIANTRDALNHIQLRLTNRDDVHFLILKDDIWAPTTDAKNDKANRRRIATFEKDTRRPQP